MIAAFPHSQHPHAPGFVKRVRQKALHGYRKLTAGCRCLPDFLIIGAQKCGTTSLYDGITQHPQMLPAEKKGLHYFDANYHKGPNWYRMYFPLLSEKAVNAITGEATPYYIFHPQAAGRIAALVPHAKLIAILRNPVHRAISHYFHEYRKGKETLPIVEAFQREGERVQAELARMTIDDTYQSAALQTFAYTMRGLYYQQLMRYAKFFPRDQILILQSEQFFQHPVETMQAVFEFLHLDPAFVPPDMHPKNTGQYHESVPLTLYEELTAYYAPHNRQLYEYLGQEFDWETKGSA